MIKALYWQIKDTQRKLKGDFKWVWSLKKDERDWWEEGRRVYCVWTAWDYVGSAYSWARTGFQEDSRVSRVASSLAIHRGERETKNRRRDEVRNKPIVISNCHTRLIRNTSTFVSTTDPHRAVRVQVQWLMTQVCINKVSSSWSPDKIVTPAVIKSWQSPG